MNNPRPNLSLKFNKSLQNLACDGPYTPLDQTMRTPAFYFAAPPANKQDSLYSNPTYNESDDILTDIDEPMGLGFKTTRNYTLAFNPTFDQLVMSIYNKILSLPTTTPFLGIVPPSGLVSKVANETMASLLSSTTNSNPPTYDHQSIINSEYLRNHLYQPIFLQLIRKRLIDLCTFHNLANSLAAAHSQNPQKLPESTTVSVTSSNNGVVMNGVGAGLKQSSISNLSLTELNISNYNANNSNNRSRSSSMSLRKQSLTRNNSYSNNNWLHVGNINSIRPHPAGIHHEQFNASTDSLQSIQDYVPQSFINRSAGASTSQNGFNTMMMDYQTPPSSNKGSISSGSSWTPPNGTSASVIQNTINSGHTASSDYEEFLLQHQAARSRSSSRSNNSLPRPLTINTECANIQALNALNGVTTPNSMNGRSGTGLALDSPFMSATTPSEDYGYFSNGFGPIPNPGSGASSSNSSISESPVNQASGNNDAMLVDSSKINLPTQFSLSEKKRDSLKMKRGIH
ncbi:uncharacterized protein CANTADRAFT_64125 [Suhomyces tanzawaensis NRRL Y-17324]|uniref:Uncharacterized protein n=1 Tax=Suhomyces tanzawaensis NRRL Y-17324 TaxID=984487 RepID=A0A1E4SKF8_9ASCO|nr:uncharacterized protein CANTADRAFT_64125 [Suhomyces tanzawaensis NRRL Y-17324]ODV79912.1 hypothetical protein CANTADRAFT_64125 [Suhomyces tanzawaensis NRRL Y-17324]